MSLKNMVRPGLSSGLLGGSKRWFKIYAMSLCCCFLVSVVTAVLFACSLIAIAATPPHLISPRDLLPEGEGYAALNSMVTFVSIAVGITVQSLFIRKALHSPSR